MKKLLQNTIFVGLLFSSFNLKPIESVWPIAAGVGAVSCLGVGVGVAWLLKSSNDDAREREKLEAEKSEIEEANRNLAWVLKENEYGLHLLEKKGNLSKDDLEQIASSFASIEHPFPNIECAEKLKLSRDILVNNRSKLSEEKKKVSDRVAKGLLEIQTAHNRYCNKDLRSELKEIRELNARTEILKLENAAADERVKIEEMKMRVVMEELVHRKEYHDQYKNLAQVSEASFTANSKQLAAHLEMIRAEWDEKSVTGIFNRIKAIEQGQKNSEREFKEFKQTMLDALLQANPLTAEDLKRFEERINQRFDIIDSTHAQLTLAFHARQQESRSSSGESDELFMPTNYLNSDNNY